MPRDFWWGRRLDLIWAGYLTSVMPCSGISWRVGNLLVDLGCMVSVYQYVVHVLKVWSYWKKHCPVQTWYESQVIWSGTESSKFRCERTQDAFEVRSLRHIQRWSWSRVADLFWQCECKSVLNTRKGLLDWHLQLYHSHHCFIMNWFFFSCG